MGPSPLARGALQAQPDHPRCAGTIPARAGSTRAAAVAEKDLTDHPRSRGEHSSQSTNTGGVAGPSPLARGARRPGRRRGQSPGTIPARAGSTMSRQNDWRPGKDHPRSRGEHFGTSAADAFKQGPSPLARGAQALHPAGQPVGGTIPARAGSTLPPRASRAAARGPSPLARGAPFRCPEHVFFVGTIPARAGSTSEAVVSSMLVRDHPRSRGEHALILGGGGLQRWTIPARAGSTRRSGRLRCGARDHPRSRGEHPPRSGSGRRQSGPSPLARGAHLLTSKDISGSPGFE